MADTAVQDKADVPLTIPQPYDVAPTEPTPGCPDYRDEPEYNWVDVTGNFLNYCDELELGELLHDTSFGLFEAMSAIEMMDPKMDAGMLCNQAKRKVLPFEQAVESGRVHVKDISFQELVAIIDDTLACMVTWLEGHSLAQTVFTNLYLHNPHLVDDRPLKAFCLCLLKIVDIMRERVTRASVFEEEDFQPMTYGFKLSEDLTEVRASGMMKEVEDELNRIIKTTRNKVGEERDEHTEIEHNEAVAAYCRLKFTRLLLLTLVALGKEKGVTEAQKYLGQMAEQLTSMQQTLDIGSKPQLLEKDSQDYPTVMGFEPLINQRLLPPTFPRYTKIKQRTETMEYLQGLVERLRTVCSVMEMTALHQLMDFFEEFSKPSPCVLSRSLLQLLYLPPNRRAFGSQVLPDVIRDTIRGFILPPVLSPRSSLVNNSQAKEYVDVFLSHTVRPVTSIIQIVGHNRARQRDKWGHILEEMATLQDAADKVDAFLHQLLVKQEPGRQHLACFGTWVLYHTLKVMINYTLSGFELELYAMHEYHYVYWYLCECLYSWLISTLTRADAFLLEQETLQEQQQKGRNAKKGKKKRKSRPHARELAIAQGSQNLCGGFYKAVVGFTVDNKLKEPRFEFDSEEVRYNHRFAPFGCLVTPPPVQYAQFKEMSCTDVKMGNPVPLYVEACKCFQQARTFFENVPNPNQEVQDLIKIAKTNFVVLKLLAGGHKKDSRVPPEFDFTCNKVFPIIKLL